MSNDTDHESEASIRRFTFSNLLLITIAVLLSIFTAIAGFAWTEVRSHDDRIKQIEENHISIKTIQDYFKNGMAQQMNQFRSELNNMETRLEKRISQVDDRVMKLYER
jgi:hypothetical protein